MLDVHFDLFISKAEEVTGTSILTKTLKLKSNILSVFVVFFQLAYANPLLAAVTKTTASTVIINEVMTANFKSVEKDFKFYDWVELYNTTSEPIDLAGWGLSNNPKNPFRWVFPVGTIIDQNAYLRVWMSKLDRKNNQTDLHTNFNVDNGNDDLLLSAPNQTLTGQVVDRLTPPLTKPDVSWCRSVDGAISPFGYCEQPTPGFANQPVTATELLAKPIISQHSGVYSAGLNVNVTGPTGAQLRYSLDGSEPTINSPLLKDNSISITQSTTFRVGAFATGKLASFPETATYIIDTSGKFNGQRLIFMTMEPKDAIDHETFGWTPSSGWKSHVEMHDEDGSIAFKLNALTEFAGQAGSLQDQDTYPFDIKFKDSVGGLDKEVTYPVFHKRPKVLKFDKLRLRNAGDDYQEAHLRDQFFQSLGEEANLVPSAVEPVQVFINSAYYGMLDLRQKEDETLIESDFGVDKDAVDYMSDKKVLEGEFAAQNFTKVLNFILANDMADVNNYETAKTLLDMENFMQDYALHIFAVSRDWQRKNMHYFGLPTYDGKWRYRLHDFDIAGDDTNKWGHKTQANVNMDDVAYGDTDKNEDSSRMMQALLKNAEFKRLYANVIADQLNTVLLPEVSSQTLLEMSTPMARYLPNHIAINNDPKSMAFWESEVARLGRFLTERIPFYEQHSQQYFALSDRQPIQVRVNNPEMGTIRVNTIDLSNRLTVTAPIWTGRYYPEYPITLEAKPKPGYAFVRWEGRDPSTNSQIQVTVDQPNLSYQAVFAPIANVKNPVINTQAINHTPRFNNKDTLVPLTLVDVASQAYETGDWVLLQIQAIDPNGYPFTFSAKKLPAGIDIHPITGMISGTFNRAGDFASTITVTNGLSSSEIAINWSIKNKGDRLVTLPTGLNGDGVGLTTSYFDNPALSGTPILTTVGLPALNVTDSEPIQPNYQNDGWSIRWDGAIEVLNTGVYSLQTSQYVDDGVRVYVNNELVIDHWSGGNTSATADVSLMGNALTPIKIEFRDISAAAKFTLNWKIPGNTIYQRVPLGVLNPHAPVIENVPPMVSIVNPATDTQFTKGAPYSILATATDTNGQIAKVEFYNGANLLSTLTQAPFELKGSTNDVPVGIYTIKAKAYDDQGAVSTSAPVIISVVSASNVFPKIAITTPANNTNLMRGAPYSIIAAASDQDGQVTKVAFYNGSTLLSTVTSAPYQIGGSTSTVPVGTYTIRAKAFDDKGGETMSEPIIINVIESTNVPPVVRITSPVKDMTIKKGQPYAIVATASDQDGRITKVEFYNGSSLLKTVKSSPYYVSGSTADVPVGSYTITAKAYDDKGGESTSKPVVIKVNNR